MKNILNKKLNKKGFTLAELLIVVAIIAILVAIAMPLYFGALDNAKKATFDANLRALKAAGVAAILQNPESLTDSVDFDAEKDIYYVIKGNVAENGDISDLTVTRTNDVTASSTYDGKTTGEMTVVTTDVDLGS